MTSLRATDKADTAITTLLDIMDALRDPQTGCPWDLQQTYESIVPYTLEEAHEVVEAIETGNRQLLKEELGDLLFQVVFYARLAKEEGLFDFADVVQTVNEKMIRRHPHVFGSDAEKAAVEMDGLWERIKQQEKQDAANSSEGSPQTASPAAPAAKTNSSNPARKSILDGIPPTLPALSQAIKMQNKAARVGFDWPGLDPVFDKMREELAELEAEIKTMRDAQTQPTPPPHTTAGTSTEKTEKSAKAEKSPHASLSKTELDPHNLARIESEYGDLLFVMANVARHLGIDPETALRSTNRKFISRFHYIEDQLATMNRTPEDSNLEEMDKLWDQSKEAGL